MNKLYNKPELNVEAFDIKDVIANNVSVEADQEAGAGELTAGMEFDVNVVGDEF